MANLFSLSLLNAARPSEIGGQSMGWPDSGAALWQLLFQRFRQWALRYALYRRQGDLAEILEWRCLGDMGALLAALLKDTDAELFCFRLSGRDALFPKEGDLIPFGMGKSLCQGLKIEKIPGETPYLGMTLD